MKTSSDLSVVDGGFASREEARAFANRLVSNCTITSKTLIQDVIADALMEVQRAVEAKYCNSIAIPDGWSLVAVREPQFDEYFVSDDGVQVGYQDGCVSFRNRNPIRLIVTKTPPTRSTE